MLIEPLSFTGTLTFKDALNLDHYHFRHIVDWPVRILLAATAALVATIIIWAGRQGEFTFFMCFVLALCVYFPFGWLLHRRLRVWWHYRSHRDEYIEHTAMFTNDSVSLSSFRADMRLNWDGLAAIVSCPRGLLFLVPPHSAWFWLPQREFDGNHKKAHILEIAREHHVRIEQMA